MKVTLIEHTPNPEKTIAVAAKMCYSNTELEYLTDNLTEEKINSFIELREKLEKKLDLKLNEIKELIGEK